MHAIERLGSRLKEAREALGYAQKRMAESVGSKLRSWQDYEAGKKVPGSAVIAGLVTLGVNANWVLTGEGPMFTEGYSSAAATAPHLDLQLVRSVVVAIEEALDELDLDMGPEDKAELVLLVYDLYAGTGVKPGKDRVLKLVKSAA